MQPVATPCWIDLETDVPAVSAFYERVMGWVLEPIAGAPGWRMALDAGSPVASIGPGEPRDWRVYLRTEDIRASVQACRAAGGQVLIDAGSVGEMGQAAVIRDPGGTPFGWWQAGRHLGFTTTGRAGTPVWFELNTHDVDAVRAFFEAVTDLPSEPMPGPMAYFTLQAEGRPRMGMLQMQQNRADEAPAWVVYFQCSDVDASAVEVADAGGAVLSGPFDSPFGRIAVCTDPLKTRFMLIQSP